MVGCGAWDEVGASAGAEIGTGAEFGFGDEISDDVGCKVGDGIAL